MYLNHSLVLPLGKFHLIPRFNIDSKLFQKITWLHRTEFPLKNKFTDKSFIFRGKKGSPHKLITTLHGVAVLFKVGDVLVVDSSQMPKRGHSQGNHICAPP